MRDRQAVKSPNIFERFSLALRLHWDDYTMVLPFLLIFMIFTVLPVAISIVLSFTSFNAIEFPKWIGLTNYYKLFMNDDLFLIALKNTIVIAVITGPFSFILCFIVAWLINEFKRMTRSILTLLFYVPSISGASYLIWQIIFSGDSNGYVNSALLQLQVIYEPIQWLTDKSYMMAVSIIVILWQSLGSSFLVFIAGLQNADKSLYEAASVDGMKNRWQELWYITLPSMKSQLLFGAVMSITASFGTGAVISGLVGFPSTDYVVHTIVHHMQDYGTTRFEMGYACAIATILFVLMISLNKLIQNMIQKLGR